MNLIEALVDTVLGICDTSPPRQGPNWPKATPWPQPPQLRPKGDGTKATDYL